VHGGSMREDRFDISEVHAQSDWAGAFDSVLFTELD